MKKAFIFLTTTLFVFQLRANGYLNICPGENGKNIKAAALAGMLPQMDSTGLPAGKNYQVRTVIIDPGHGGHDPGCSGAGSKEKNLCLAIGKYLAKALKENFPDVKVIMTRNTDVFIPLNERANIATRNKADLFISIHCNYMPKGAQAHGTETYVLGLHATEANLEVAKRENASILLEENYQETYGYDPNSAEAHIMFSMFQNAFLEQSISFAQKVQRQAADEAVRKDRGVKQAGFLVLRHATMPSVLVETGYLSNRDEENYLRSEKGQKTMANALLSAFSEYKLEMEGKDATISLQKLEVETASPEPEPQEKDTGELTETGKKLNETTAVELAVVVPAKQESIKTEPAKNTKPNPVVPANVSKMPQVQAAEIEKPPIKKHTNESPSTASGKIIPSNPVAEKPAQRSAVSTQSADVQYCVQMAASPKLLDIGGGKWAQVSYLIEVLEEGGLYKYQIRNFATAELAAEVKQKLRSQGFSDAFVVAYQQGKRIILK